LAKRKPDYLHQTDCNMQGYVIDGFPKTKEQLQELEVMKIHPSFIVVLEASDDVIYSRFE
jgi:adenylate kinase